MVSALFNSQADWSLVPSFDAGISIVFESEGAVDGQLRSNLYIIYFLVGAGKREKRKTIVQEVTWRFEEELAKWEPMIWVRVYFANPTRGGLGWAGGRLKVVFEGVEVVVRK